MSPLLDEDTRDEKPLDEDAPLDDAALEAAACESDAELIDDPEALAEAEAAVNAIDPDDVYEQATEEWVRVFGPSKISGLADEAGVNSFVLTSPLDAEGIPYIWDPYPPEKMPSYRYLYGATDRPFTLLVPKSRQADAMKVLGIKPGSQSMFGLPPEMPRSMESERARWYWFFMFLMIVVLAYLAYRATMPGHLPPFLR